MQKPTEKSLKVCGTHRSLFYNVSATVRLGNCLTLSILRFKFLSTGLTDKQMDKTNCLTPSRMRWQGNNMNRMMLK